MRKKKKPKFNVPNAGGKRGKKRVKQRWRKPRGIDNKKRVKKKSAGKSPKIGYKNAEKIRFLHPSKAREVLIHNEKEVEELKERAKKEKIAIRIASAVGKKKRALIVKKAQELNIRVLNKPKEG